MKNVVENTTETFKTPVGAFAAMVGGSEGIVASEARGQSQFCESDVLPVSGPSDEELTALGFELGGPVRGDKLFRYAKLPAGWQKKSTGHSMWSEIVDETGKKRFSVFYKAAFYDRDAFMQPAREPAAS